MSRTNHPRAFALAVFILKILFLQILAGFTPSSPSLLYTNAILVRPLPATYLNCNILCFLFPLATSFFLAIAYLAHSTFYLFFLLITWNVSIIVFTGLPSVPRISWGAE